MIVWTYLVSNIYPSPDKDIIFVEREKGGYAHVHLGYLSEEDGFYSSSESNEIEDLYIEEKNVQKWSYIND